MICKVAFAIGMMCQILTVRPVLKSLDQHLYVLSTLAADADAQPGADMTIIPAALVAMGVAFLHPFAAPKRRYPEGPPEQRMPTIGDRRESKTVCRVSLAGRRPRNP
ncbi:MAG TPA: hypothetical protein VMF32_19325 [Xanthobacteraceae bacterium]|nr:hypothetical protein [Xanthobacteraceae bacterium]